MAAEDSTGTAAGAVTSPAVKVRFNYDESVKGAERSVNRIAMDYRNGEMEKAEALERIGNIVEDAGVSVGYTNVQLGSDGSGGPRHH